MYEIPLPVTFPITEISCREEGVGTRIRGIKENCKALEQNHRAPPKEGAVGERRPAQAHTLTHNTHRHSTSDAQPQSKIQ